MEVIRAALPEAKRRYKEQNPNNGWKFDMIASPATLIDPNNPKNVFYGTVDWATNQDPYAACDIRINFPNERLKNGQGYIGLKFRDAIPSGASSYIETELLILHGIGSIGLVEPLSVSTTEYLSDGCDPTTKPIWTPTSFVNAAFILERFGLESAK